MSRDAVEVLQVDATSISFSEHGEEPHFAHEATKNALERAAEEIRAGKLVAFPTETVYGLGASAVDEEAVKKIFAAKNRPADNPLIIHVSSRAMLMRLIGSKSVVPESYTSLMEHFWPGPLSLLFPLAASSMIASSATAGLSTVVIRIPDNAIARALIALAGVPIAAPSANTSGRPSPTTAQHVAADMQAAHGFESDWPRLLILDGGPCGVGVESTVVDGTQGRLRALRLGGLSPERIQQATEFECDLPSTLKSAEAPRTPGQKYRHYAPDARVVMLHLVHDASAPSFAELADTEQEVVGLLSPEPSALGSVSERVHRASLGSSADDNARLLFAGLRDLEKRGAKVIFVESGDSWSFGLGRTVAERLSKAAKGEGNEQQIVRVRR